MSSFVALWQLLFFRYIHSAVCEYTTCLAYPVDRVNRSAIGITVARHSWTSHELISSVAEIVLREILGFTVVRSYPESAEVWGHDIAAGVYDIDLEQWNVDSASDQFVEYVTDLRQVLVVGEVGYTGRSGLYTFRSTLEQSELADYYKFYQNGSEALRLGFPGYQDSQLAGILGNDFPICDPEDTVWCGTGDWQGYWAPTVCQLEPCVEIYKGYPTDDEGYFEQLIKESGLRAFFGYYGESFSQVVDQAAGQPIVLHAVRPSVLVSKHDLVRISFEDYSPGCDVGNTKNPITGDAYCDQPEARLQKVVSRRVREQAPEAVLFLSLLHISDEDMRDMLLSTADAGGPHLESFDAACGYVLSNMDKVHRWAPTCIRSPDQLEEGEVERFNSDMLACENVTLLRTYPPLHCPGGRVGTEDRSMWTVRLSTRNWLTAIVVVHMIEVVLRDLLGYNVVLVDTGGRSSASTHEDIATGLFDVEPESWQHFFGDSRYKTYIEPGKVIFAGNTGFLGDQGLFVPKVALEINSMMSFYKFFKNATLAAADGFLQHKNSPLHNVADKICTQSLMPWCGTGSSEGFYVPYVCRSNPGECLELVMSYPQYAEGYYEQVINNLGLRVVLAYYGAGPQFEWLSDFAARGVLPLYYWWSPDPYNYVVESTRVSLPDYESSCAIPSDNVTPDGAGACEYPPIFTAKLVAPRVKESMPEAFYAISKFEIFQDDWDTLLPRHVSVGGSSSTTTEELVCDFLAASSTAERIRAWAPDCMVTPPAPEDVVVNDTLFSAAEGECMAITCPRHMVLHYREDTQSFVCDLCPSGDVADAVQRYCVPCQTGTRVSDDLANCDPCPSGRYSLARSSECLPCEPGSFANITGLSACMSCPTGTHQVAHGRTACVNCELGRFAAETGMSTCSECNPGTATNATGMSVCHECPVGTYQRERGESLCLECQPGRIARVSGSFTCTECFQGFYQENRSATACERCPTGRFAPDVASTACHACEYGTTNTTAADSAEDCTCPPGTFKLNQECVVCQLKYMECAGGDAAAIQKPGYAVSADAAKVYRCASETACPGGKIGTCPEGGFGLACAECEDQEYIWDGRQCARCSSAEAYFVVILFIALVLALVLIHHFGNDPVSLSFSMTSEFIVLVGLVANVFLALNSFNGFDVEWEEPLATFLKISQWLAKEVTQIRVGCSVSFGIVAQYMLSSLVPGVVAAVLTAIALLHLASPRKLFNTYATIAYSLYLLLVMHAVKPFRFIVHPAPHGKSVLDIPSVLEGTDEHAALVAGGVLVLLIYCLPFALVCVVATITVKRAHKRISQRWWLMSFRFLFYKFRPEYHYWGLCILLRNAVYALAPSIAPASPKIGLFLLSIMAAANSAHTAMTQPWRHRWMTITDVAIQCYILLVLQLAFGWVEEDDFADNFVANVLMAVAGITTVLGLALLLHKFCDVLFLSNEKRQERALKEARLAAEYLDNQAASIGRRSTEVADALEELYEPALPGWGLHTTSLHDKVSHSLLLVSHMATEIGYYAEIAASMNDPEYTLQHFYEDCLRVMPELTLYDPQELEGGRRRASVACDNGRTMAEEKLRTLGALFAVFCLCRLHIDGKEILSFGVDEKKPHIVRKPPNDITKESLAGIPWGKMTPMQRRASFYWTFDWDLLQNLCIQAGMLQYGDNKTLVPDTRADGRLVAMLCLTAFHDIMKDTSLCPVVYGDAYEAYAPGERIHDHDMALAYLLDRHAELLPSFRILTLEQRKLVRFTQSEMGFNAGWLVQAEGPPSAVLKRLKRAIASGGAKEMDVAFYFVHWVTDLAGAEPTPFAGSEKFAAKFPPFVLQGLLGCFSIVKMLADHSETEVYEAYLLKRWTEAASKDGNKIGLPPAGHEAIAQMRLLCMAQGAAHEVLQAFNEMPDEERKYLAKELAETGMPGQQYRDWQEEGGPCIGTPFLLYYGPAWCQRAGQTHPKLTLRILAQVLRLAREAYPESSNASQDVEEDVCCRTIQVGILKSLELETLEDDSDDGHTVLQVVRESRLEGKLDTSYVFDM